MDAKILIEKALDLEAGQAIRATFKSQTEAETLRRQLYRIVSTLRDILPDAYNLRISRSYSPGEFTVEVTKRGNPGVFVVNADGSQEELPIESFRKQGE